MAKVPPRQRIRVGKSVRRLRVNHILMPRIFRENGVGR